MGPSTERQHSASKDSSKRIRRQRRQLCVNTDLLCPQNATGPSTLQQLDLSDRRHFNSLSTCRSSNSRSLYVSTSRVLQRLRPDRLAAQQSHIWTTQQPKSLAKSPSRGDATIGTTTPCEWAQRLRKTWRRRLHPMLRGRPPFHWSTGAVNKLFTSWATPSQTNRNWNTYSGTSRELNTTSSAWDQQPKHQQLKQHQTSRSLSTVTGPDVPQESRQQAFWSKSLEQQSTTAAEHSQQLTIALSSAEAELYAINTGATEALHISNLLTERSSQHEEDQHPHPHPLVKRKEHGNSQTHRAQTPVYTTAGRTWPGLSRSTPSTTRPTSSPSTLQQRRFCVTSVMLGSTHIITKLPNNNKQQFHCS